MSKSFPLSALPAITALLAGSVHVNYMWSQTTASILIYVKDADRLSVVGHKLTLKSADRMVQRVLYTDIRGEASVAGLLPGLYYLEGNSVWLKVDELAIVRLHLRSAQATVVIETSPLLAETSSVGVQTSFASQDLERLPLPTHRYVEYSYLVPSISPSGKPEPVVLGSMLDSNSFLIDGMPTNLSSTGRFGLNISSEIIESQTLTTGGHKAEIGFAAGGVFSIATKSGTNEFSGSLVGYSIWRGMNSRPFKDLINTPEERATDAREWAVTLGGPIIKDKLLFFGGFNRQLSSLDYENIRPAGGEPRMRNQDEDRSYRFLKLTWFASGDHRMEFEYFGDPVTQTAFNTAGDSSLKDEQMSNRNRGGDSYLLHHAGVLTQTLTWENTLGIHNTSFYTYPTTPDAGPYRSELDAPGNESFGRYADERLERIRNLSFRSELTLITGLHRVKAGFQGLQSEYTLAFARPSGGMSYQDRAAGGNGPDAATLASIRSGLAQHNDGLDYGYDTLYSLATASPVSGYLVGGRGSYLYQRTLASMEEYGSPLKLRIAGVFVQDDLQLSPNWVLNIGVRYDQAKLDTEDGQTAYSQNLISPRIGISWDPTTKGEFRLFAYAGRIYSPPTPGTITAAGAVTGGPATERQVWIPDSQNPSDASKGKWKTWQTTGVQGVRNVAMADLSAPKTDLYQLGAKRMQNIPCLGVWIFEAVATVKHVRDLIDTYEPIFGYLPELDVLADSSAGKKAIANLPGLNRDFFGFDLTVHRRFESGHRMQFSYSYGELTGNSEVGNVQSATGRNTGFAQIPSLREDYRLPQYNGLLNESLRHSFKAFGSAKLPYSFELSGVFALRTGMRYSSLIRTGGYNILVPGAARGDQILPGVASLDIALAYSRKINSVNVRLAAEVFNLANSQPMTVVNNTDPTFAPGNHQQPRAFQFSCRVMF
ncbi:MAG: TonB-dependent receptor [Holophagales bacterium]|jgi:hypothetical protein|nr:TonB-dependent receptor [Holophagales bacterium]